MSSEKGQATSVAVSAGQVKALREKTGAGFNDCRAALVESKGDMEEAISILRKKGQAAAAKKAQRSASEGAVGTYLHAGGKIASLVEVNCESDFVARTEEFKKLCHELAMHVAAQDPRFIRKEDVPADVIEHERVIYFEQARSTGKPEGVLGRIVDGKLEKFFAETCLYEQHFIRDEQLTVRELIQQAIAKVGENITVRRFARFKVGEQGAGAEPGAAAADSGETPVVPA